MAWFKRIPLLGKIARHIGVVTEKPYSPQTERLRGRIDGPDVQATVSVCPYCAVGCSQLIYHRGNQILSIEGNPASPINAGTLCPKGAATYQLAVNPLRLTTVKYRAPYATEWEERSLEWAMERIAGLVRQTRDAHWRDRDDKGVPLNHTLAIGHLGGATLDNEENYFIKKLFTALGIVWVENQARI